MGDWKSNGKQSRRGGKRVGAGRKAGPKTILAKMNEIQLDEECDKSLTFLAKMRDSEEVSDGVRASCAMYLIDRRKGKPKTSTHITTPGNVSLAYEPAPGAEESADKREDGDQ